MAVAVALTSLHMLNFAARDSRACVDMAYRFVEKVQYCYCVAHLALVACTYKRTGVLASIVMGQSTTRRAAFGAWGPCLLRSVRLHLSYEYCPATIEVLRVLPTSTATGSNTL